MVLWMLHFHGNGGFYSGVRCEPLPLIYIKQAQSSIYICVKKGATFHSFLTENVQNYSANLASGHGMTRTNNGAACSTKDFHFATYAVYIG